MQEAADEVRVYLAIPKYGPLSQMFLLLQMRIVVEAESFEGMLQTIRPVPSEEEIEFQQLGVRVLLSTEDLSGYELLPVAQIRGLANREVPPRLIRFFHRFSQFQHGLLCVTM